MRFVLFFISAVLIGAGIRPALAANTAPPRVLNTVAPFERTLLVNQVQYDFLFLPADSSKSITQASYDSASQILVIKFRVRIPGFAESPLRYKLPTIEDYEARLKFFAFEFGKTISLVQDSAACKQAGYSMDANLNAGPFETFIMAYRLPKPLLQTDSALHLQMEDPVLSGSIIDVVINKEDLQ